MNKHAPYSFTILCWCSMSKWLRLGLRFPSKRCRWMAEQVYRCLNLCCWPSSLCLPSLWAWASSGFGRWICRAVRQAIRSRGRKDKFSRHFSVWRMCSRSQSFCTWVVQMLLSQASIGTRWTAFGKPCILWQILTLSSSRRGYRRDKYHTGSGNLISPSPICSGHLLVRFHVLPYLKN